MTIDIREMTLSNVPDLIALFNQSASNYSQYFTPFSFDTSTFYSLLRVKQRDRYYCILVDKQVAGFYMLRGLDQAYTTPAFGVWIAEEYSGQGLARSTLNHAVIVCAQLGCHDLLLKVHPENKRAKRMYERFGFRQVAIDSTSHNIIYRLEL